MTLRRLARRAAPPVLGVAAAAVLVPDVLRLDGRLPMIATVAWRPQALAAAVGGAGLLATWRPARPVAAALGAVGLAGGVALGARLRRTAVRAEPAGDPADLTILSLNVFGGRADTAAVAA